MEGRIETSEVMQASSFEEWPEKETDALKLFLSGVFLSITKKMKKKFLMIQKGTLN